MHDLAIITVSTNEAHWIRAAAADGLRAHGRHPRRRGRGRQRLARRDGRRRGRRVPRGAHGWSRQPRLRAREQPRADDLQRALRAVPEPGHRDPRGHLRRTRAPAWTSARRSGLVGCRQITAEGRARHDDPLLPERAARARRGAVRRADCPGGRAGSASASSTRPPTSARPNATGRAARSCSPAARRSRAPAASTSASSCTPTRPTSAGGSRRPAGRSGTCRR